jgi:LmbE family N-acetylglucosaminyl deacetylase
LLDALNPTAHLAPAPPAGDLSDPHGTHRACLQALVAALRQLREAGESPWLGQCRLWLYRGAWQEWGLELVDLVVPLSPVGGSGRALAHLVAAGLPAAALKCATRVPGAAQQPRQRALGQPASTAAASPAAAPEPRPHPRQDEVARKRDAIFRHQSQKDRPLFPGHDEREFWQRAEQRNAATAALYDSLGLPQYSAIEAFVCCGPDLAREGAPLLPGAL